MINFQMLPIGQPGQVLLQGNTDSAMVITTSACAVSKYAIGPIRAGQVSVTTYNIQHNSCTLRSMIALGWSLYKEEQNLRVFL